MRKVDTHAKRIANVVGYLEDATAEVIDGRPYAEALKVTACNMVEVANKSLFGGYEDCLDAVRVGKLVVRQCRMYAGPETRVFVTAKGGGFLHVYRDIELHGNPRWWSFSLGDWTLYNHNPDMPPMKEVVLNNVRRADGKRFVVLQIYCDKVVLIDTRAVVINLRWIAKLWFALLRKVRKPEPGSEQPIPAYLR